MVPQLLLLSSNIRDALSSSSKPHLLHQMRFVGGRVPSLMRFIIISLISGVTTILIKKIASLLFQKLPIPVVN